MQGFTDTYTAVENTSFMVNRIDKEIDIHDDLHHSFKHIWRVLTNCTIQSSVEWFSLKEMDWPSSCPVREICINESMVVQTRNAIRKLKRSKEKLLCSTNLIWSFDRLRSSHLPKVKPLGQCVRWMNRTIRFQRAHLEDSANRNHSSTGVHLDSGLPTKTKLAEAKATSTLPPKSTKSKLSNRKIGSNFDILPQGLNQPENDPRDHHAIWASSPGCGWGARRFQASTVHPAVLQGHVSRPLNLMVHRNFVILDDQMLRFDARKNRQKEDTIL